VNNRIPGINRPGNSNFREATSSSEANPLDLARLLANDEQHKVFTKHFLGRPIFAPKYGNVRNLNLEDRLLHYILSYVIIPKFSNHSTTTFLAYGNASTFNGFKTIVLEYNRSRF
ncbi:hypothetical protein Lal_00037548, partial [Lupinus albus]